MRLNLFYLLTCICNFAVGQLSNDTVTNWQLYKDSMLLLSGNEMCENATLPLTIVGTADNYENLRLVFRYDWYSGELERKIGFYVDGKQVGEFKINGSVQDFMQIPKAFIDRTFTKHLNKAMLIRYSDTKYFPTGISIGMILFSQSNCISEQTIDKVLIEFGDFNNYDRYDLGDFYFYNGKFEHNLKYKFQRKEDKEIVYTRNDTLSDAMILKPKFFCNTDKSTAVIMIEVAAEYSWGQEILLIKDHRIMYLGYLDYAVNMANGESISDYCGFLCEDGKLIMIFEDIPIIYWPDEPNLINGKDLKFELSDDEIKRID